MNTRLPAVLNRLGPLAAALAIVAVAAGCPPSTIVPRSPGTDGSARWGWAIAQPKIAAVAADAELRTIIGTSVNLDGRLPANTGSWSFVAWSPAQAKTVQTTINFDGTASTSPRNEAAPGPGIQIPLPASWADSIQVFAATAGKRGAGATLAPLVVLNLASYSQAPGKATWGINFNSGGPNQLVAVDGTYIGPE